jgi:hypothetical protein
MALVDTGNYLMWQALKSYLPPGTSLSSCYRPAAAQLAFIVRKATKEGYTFGNPPTLRDESSWSGALALLRKKGYKVAPPGKSNHQSGLAYDLSGPSLPAILAGVEKALAAGRITLLQDSRSNLIIEHKNHCVHVEIESALIDHEPFEFV